MVYIYVYVVIYEVMVARGISAVLTRTGADSCCSTLPDLLRVQRGQVYCIVVLLFILILLLLVLQKALVMTHIRISAGAMGRS